MKKVICVMALLLCGLLLFAQTQDVDVAIKNDVAAVTIRIDGHLFYVFFVTNARRNPVPLSSGSYISVVHSPSCTHHRCIQAGR